MNKFGLFCPCGGETSTGCGQTGCPLYLAEESFRELEKENRDLKAQLKRIEEVLEEV